MGSFVKGDVVVTPFPFSDLSAVKRRPGLVLADLYAGDVLLTMISGHSVAPEFETAIDDIDFAEGSLSGPSFVRADRLFTAASTKISYRVGKLSREKVSAVISNLIDTLQRG